MDACFRLRKLAGPACAVAVLAALTGAVAAQDHSHHNGGMGPFLSSPLTQSAELSTAVPPLWDNLGGLHYAITTADPQAQKYFDQGLRLAYGFNHAEAQALIEILLRLRVRDRK